MHRSGTGRTNETPGCPLAGGSPPSAAGPRDGSAGRAELCFQRLLQEGAGTAEGTVPCLEPSPSLQPLPSPDGGVGQHVLPGLTVKGWDTQVPAQLCHIGWEEASPCFPSKTAPPIFLALLQCQSWWIAPNLACSLPSREEPMGTPVSAKGLQGSSGAAEGRCSGFQIPAPKSMGQGLFLTLQCSGAKHPAWPCSCIPLYLGHLSTEAHVWVSRFPPLPHTTLSLLQTTHDLNALQASLPGSCPCSVWTPVPRPAAGASAAPGQSRGNRQVGPLLPAVPQHKSNALHTGEYWGEIRLEWTNYCTAPYL